MKYVNKTPKLIRNIKFMVHFQDFTYINYIKIIYCR